PPPVGPARSCFSLRRFSHPDWPILVVEFAVHKQIHGISHWWRPCARDGFVGWWWLTMIAAKHFGGGTLLLTNYSAILDTRQPDQILQAVVDLRPKGERNESDRDRGHAVDMDLLRPGPGTQ